MVPVKTVLPPKITLNHESITQWPSIGTPWASAATDLIIILCSRKLFLLSSSNVSWPLWHPNQCTYTNSLNRKAAQKRTERKKLNNYNLVQCQTWHWQTLHNKLEQELSKEAPSLTVMWQLPNRQNTGHQMNKIQDFVCLYLAVSGYQTKQRISKFLNSLHVSQAIQIITLCNIGAILL